MISGGRKSEKGGRKGLETFRNKVKNFKRLTLQLLHQLLTGGGALALPVGNLFELIN